MGILSKKKVAAVEPEITLNERLKAASAKRFAASAIQSNYAESLRDESIRAVERAELAEREAEAIVKAFTILDDAGVTV